MKEDVLFFKAYADYHTNGANRAYWAKLFNSISRRLQENRRMRLYSSFDENMPIYEFHSDVRGRFIRVMQYDPMNEVVASEKYSPRRFFTAWIDERATSIEGVKEPELVICLLMSRANIIMAKKLIDSWLFDNDEMTKELIDRVYAEQERLDKGDDEYI